MLQKLLIENVAVIERAEIDFSSGFNVLTGETGAGKSIVIDSLNLVLGQRSNRELIRTGAAKASVTAVFSGFSRAAGDKLREYGVIPDEDGNLFIEREISSDGRGAAKINGRPVPVSMLRDLSEALVNIHGQHDSQSLMNEERHIDFLDDFADISILRKAYQEEFSRLSALRADLRAIKTNEEQKSRRVELLNYQIDEIESCNLTAGEEEELLALRKRAQNMEKIVTALSAVHEALSGGEYSGASDMIQNAAGELTAIEGVYPEISESAEKLYELSYSVEDISADIKSRLDDIDSDIDINEVEARIDVIFRLKSKYGNSIDEILEYCEKAKKELDEFENSDKAIAELKSRIISSKASATELASKMSEYRADAAKRLEEKVTEELSFLDMKNSVFQVKTEVGETLTPNGFDTVTFLLSANLGEVPRALAKIASGGELSRIMLAIKNALSEKNDAGSLVFDEIDAGVSGRAAQKIGIKLKEISQSHQILCVTHLAQIAAYGDTHLFISKESRDGRTYTRIRTLGYDERKNELARIMGGDLITETTLKSAGELLEYAKNKVI